MVESLSGHVDGLQSKLTRDSLCDSLAARRRKQSRLVIEAIHHRPIIAKFKSSQMTNI